MVSIKRVMLLLAFLFPAFRGLTQYSIPYSYKQVTKAFFDNCAPSIKYLVKDARIKKRSGNLSIPIAGKKTIIFTDDGEFEENEYLGDIRNTQFSLVKNLGPNDEHFYLINRSTGVIDTLIGVPFFSANMTDFVCVNNPGTDEPYEIQICELKHDKFRIRGDIKRPDGLVSGFRLITEVRILARNSILARDDKGNYWLLTLKGNG